MNITLVITPEKELYPTYKRIDGVKHVHINCAPAIPELLMDASTILIIDTLNGRQSFELANTPALITIEEDSK